MSGRGRGRRRKNTRGRPRQSRTTAPASAAQSSREGAGSAGGGNSSSGDPSSHVVTARRTPASGGSSSACAVARNPVRRRQNSGSARGSSEQSSGTAPAPSIRGNALYASRSTGVRGNATYQPGYHAAAAQARTAARAEARIDGRSPDVSIGMVERHVAPPAGTTSHAAAPNSRRRRTREVPRGDAPDRSEARRRRGRGDHDGEEEVARLARHARGASGSPEHRRDRNRSPDEGDVRMALDNNVATDFVGRRDGKWTCKICSYQNEPTHKSCQMCASVVRRDGRWTCKICTYTNEPTHKSCQMCGQSHALIRLRQETAAAAWRY